MAHSVEQEKVPLVAEKYDWDLETAQTNIRKTQTILGLMHPIDAIEFLLGTTASTGVICDGCNVRPPFEHRCHESRAMVNGEQTGLHCNCPDCFVMNNLIDS